MATVAQFVTSITSLGEASTVLLYTAPSAGTYVEINVLAGASISAGWYNGAQDTILDVGSTALGLPGIKFGPLASGDKIFGTSHYGESKTVVVKFQFDTV